VWIVQSQISTDFMAFFKNYIHQQINSSKQKTKDYYILTFNYYQSTTQVIDLKKQLDKRVLIVNITPDYPEQLKFITQFLDIAFDTVEDIKFINILYIPEEEADVTVLEIQDSTNEDYYLRFERYNTQYTFGKLLPSKKPIFKSDLLDNKKIYISA
jgi:hypothetical protein